MPTNTERYRTCLGCGDKFFARHLHQKHCRASCKDRLENQRRRKLKKQRLEEQALLAIIQIMKTITLSNGVDRIDGKLLEKSGELQGFRQVLEDDWEEFFEFSLKEYRIWWLNERRAKLTFTGSDGKPLNFCQSAETAARELCQQLSPRAKRKVARYGA